VTVALIATVRNEAAELPAFLDSILKQTRKPDFIVITSGKSDDETDEILQEFEDKHYEDGFVWLPLDGGNRSFGRNEAIGFAVGAGADIIACTNCSVLSPDWLAQIILPIELDAIDLVGGFWAIRTYTDREEAMALLTQWSDEQVREPAALSMAFTSEVWKNAGGFPEDLDTSEDTEFVRRARALAIDETFVPNAIVTWRPKTLTLRDATRTYYKYAVTDGKAGLLPGQYGATYLVYALYFGALATMPWLGAFWLLAWLGFRVRKVVRKGLLFEVPYTMAAALAMDMARMIGYVRGKLHARFDSDS